MGEKLIIRKATPRIPDRPSLTHSTHKCSHHWARPCEISRLGSMSSSSRYPPSYYPANPAATAQGAGPGSPGSGVSHTAAVDRLWPFFFLQYLIVLTIVALLSSIVRGGPCNWLHHRVDSTAATNRWLSTQQLSQSEVEGRD